MQTNSSPETTRRRKWILCEFGDVFWTAKSRVARLSFSQKWKSEKPSISNGLLGIVKVQSLEQYEDVIANLDTAWDEAALPEGVPVRYLFRPDENRVRLGLDLSRPFANTLRAGKAGEPHSIDLLETWALLQGYWVRSRRVYVEGGRRYVCLETTCGCLVLLRDITEPEDDSAAIGAIVERYRDASGALRVQRLELNHWADLRRLPLPARLLAAADFDRGAAWN